MNGATQVLTCTHCGSSVGRGSIFCKDCGATILPPTSLITSSADVQPQLERKRRHWKWLVVAIAILPAYLMWQCGSGMSAGARLSDDAVRHFHSQLDSEAYADILGESDEAFRNSENRDEIIKFLTGVHSKLGLSRGFNRTKIFVNATISGTLITVTYKSTFDQGNAVEAFTWRKAPGGLKLVRYDINSNTFVIR